MIGRSEAWNCECRQIIPLRKKEWEKQSHPSGLEPCLRWKEPHHGVCLRSCLLVLAWQWGGRWFLWEWGIWGSRACLPAEPSEAKYFVGGIVLGVGEGGSE